MKKFLLFVILCFTLFYAESQELFAKDFMSESAFTQKKMDSYLSKNKFRSEGSRMQIDTIVNGYSLKRTKRKKDSTTIIQNIETYRTKDNFSFSLSTSSRDEYIKNIALLKREGFFCGSDSHTANIFLFQKKDISVLVNKITDTTIIGDTLYSFSFHKADLPLPINIKYAEDLMPFTSHEYLVSVFGEKNVIKDIYFFLEKKTAKCSVLFPRTNQQAVFIWDDEVNLCKASQILIGGNITTASFANYDGVIEENIWRSKEGIYWGMSLNSLIKLNGNDFNFYGKNTNSPYMVVPENTGVLNFKNTRVILGCLNNNGSALLSNAKVSADEILNHNTSLYVFMMMVVPPATSKN